MRTPQTSLLAVATLSLASCAMSMSSSHSLLAFTGRVTEIQSTTGTTADMGVYRPGMGGAVGGLVAGIMSAARSTPDHSVFVIQTSEGAQRTARTKDTFKVGECVSIFTAPNNATGSPWNYGEATLKSSSTCTKE